MLPCWTKTIFAWASFIVLSERICAESSQFSLAARFDGTGLLNVVTASAKIPEPFMPSGIATAYHPDVLVNLRANINAEPPSSLPDYSSPMDEPFDLIKIPGYHPDHARWIQASVKSLLLHPSSSVPEA
ncbi:hypothetical protein BDP27DRAFT_1325682 [Rhodocollybia butyracea]|uniref:Uncharacterized protein n=1 Tax=Rhodocollybia butyracea TaxID=206335 RepID=A0A9P5PNS4_9AGAR|nr:hypothetical protein BDP27DRAFT_1325682 [Rhodocollybia butyracea]